MISYIPYLVCFISLCLDIAVLLTLRKDTSSKHDVLLYILGAFLPFISVFLLLLGMLDVYHALSLIWLAMTILYFMFMGESLRRQDMLASAGVILGIFFVGSSIVLWAAGVLGWWLALVLMCIGYMLVVGLANKVGEC